MHSRVTDDGHDLKCFYVPACGIGRSDSHWIWLSSLMVNSDHEWETIFHWTMF